MSLARRPLLKIIAEHDDKVNVNVHAWRDHVHAEYRAGSFRAQMPLENQRMHGMHFCNPGIWQKLCTDCMTAHTTGCSHHTTAWLLTPHHACTPLQGTTHMKPDTHTQRHTDTHTHCTHTHTLQTPMHMHIKTHTVTVDVVFP